MTLRTQRPPFFTPNGTHMMPNAVATAYSQNRMEVALRM
jgi:hypothetical protein